ncbi:mitochondrial carrier domain-containing protein [Chytriomyces sp. MP71]|nr:mitochondrial carrier domain-containing protein [Chytriomyces sp. MP71]
MDPFISCHFTRRPSMPSAKTVLQVSESNAAGMRNCQPRSSWQICQSLMKTEGVKGFYTGFAPQLAGSMIETSALFLCYNQIQSMVRWMSHTPADTPLSIGQLIASGFLAGGMISFALTPIELAKCKLQVQCIEPVRVLVAHQPVSENNSNVSTIIPIEKEKRKGCNDEKSQ